MSAPTLEELREWCKTISEHEEFLWARNPQSFILPEGIASTGAWIAKNLPLISEAETMRDLLDEVRLYGSMWEWKTMQGWNSRADALAERIKGGE